METRIRTVQAGSILSSHWRGILQLPPEVPRTEPGAVKLAEQMRVVEKRLSRVPSDKS
jgi:hypothetical protein